MHGAAVVLRAAPNIETVERLGPPKAGFFKYIDQKKRRVKMYFLFIGHLKIRLMCDVFVKMLLFIDWSSADSTNMRI